MSAAWAGCTAEPQTASLCSARIPPASTSPAALPRA
jgi:hypothetical protein